MIVFLGSWIYFAARDRHRRRYPEASYAASREYGFEAVWRWMKRLIFLGLALALFGFGAMEWNNAKGANADKKAKACLTAHMTTDNPPLYPGEEPYVPSYWLRTCQHVN